MDASSSSSSSPMGLTCFYCNSISSELKQGWRRWTTGGYAMICDQCASAYEEGRFCNIFHLKADGWRNCVTCDKAIHCGCIMSAHTHILLDVCGVECMECSSLRGPSRLDLSVDSDREITGQQSTHHWKKRKLETVGPIQHHQLLNQMVRSL